MSSLSLKILKNTFTCSTSAELISSLLIMSLLSFTVYCGYYIFLHPLSSVPGPWLAKVTNFWRYYHYLRGNCHQVQAGLFEKYQSSVVRIAPNSILYADSASYKVIHSHGDAFTRGDFYRMIRFADRRASSLFSAKENATHHEKRRRVVSVAFTPRACLSYENVISKQINTWIEEIGKNIDSYSRILDIAYLNKALTFDMLWEILIGESPGLQDIWTTPRFQTAIRHKEWTSKHGFGWGFVPIIAAFIELLGFIARPVFYKPKFDQQGLPILRTLLYWRQMSRAEFTLLPEAKSLGPTGSERSVLHKLVSLPSKDPRKINREEEILVEIQMMTFAGPSTTYAALTSVLYDLAIYAEWQEKLRAEVMINSKFGDGSRALSTPLLTAFVNESLRVRPIDPLAFPLEVDKPGGLSIPGCKIPLPRGTEVGALFYLVNRDKTVWGSDADEFRPDRWLTDDKEELRIMKESWTVFGRGIRCCPGETIANSLISKCIICLLKNWRVSAEEGCLQGCCNFEMSYWTLPLRFEPIV